MADSPPPPPPREHHWVCRSCRHESHADHTECERCGEPRLIRDLPPEVMREVSPPPKPVRRFTPPMKELAGFLTFVCLALTALCTLFTYLTYEQNGSKVVLIAGAVATAWLALITVFLAIYHKRR